MGTEPLVIFDIKALKRYWIEIDNLPENIGTAEVTGIMESAVPYFEIPVTQCNMVVRGKVYFIRRNRKKQFIVYNILGDYDGLGTGS